MGWVSMLAVVNQMLDLALVAMLVAVVLDGFDGFTARLLNVQSEFGKMFDSLADTVAFGVAPAMLIWQWQNADLNAALLAFIYLLAVVVRLARYNAEPRRNAAFSGLPCPAAAAAVATGIAWAESGIAILSVAGPVAIVALACLMITRLRYAHPMRQRWLMGRLLITVVLLLSLGLLFLGARGALFTLVSAYVLSGLIGACLPSLFKQSLRSESDVRP
ncbi:MAG: hypothetical protein HKM24_04730 [Gammaproteobacteria bacterium]|nr:hypothetical protein [Gammaproteobacteria bacterium]